VADFKELLAELAKGRGNLEAARAHIDESLLAGAADPGELLTQIEGAGLPGPVANLLRNQIGRYTGQGGDDPNKTVIDLGLSLDSPAEAERTQVSTDAPDGAFPFEVGSEERTVVDASAGAERTVVQDAERTVVTDGDRTIQGGGAGDFDPFAADSARTQQPTGGTGGTAWPGRGSGGVQKQIGPGTILKDRFELISPLGEGGMGVVYKARDLLKVEAKDKNPYIAVKLLSGDFRNHPESFIALQRESSKAQRLAHPNIATVFDFDRDSGTVYMTMEILEGQELAKYIKKLPAGGLPIDEALKVIHQLADGLSYAHQRGLVHSDFKPGNAFILNDGTVKIMDFGIARASKTKADAAGETTVFDPGQLGALTPAYATVEMFEGQDPAPPDDIYALGCVAYELLTGKHPFNKLSAPKVLEKGLSPAPVVKPGWSKRQNKALMKSLALKREHRTQSVEEFWENIRPKKDYTLQIAAGVTAVVIVIGALGYGQVKTYLEDKRNNQIIANVQAGGASVIPEVLAQLDAYDKRSRDMILEGAKEQIISYFQNQAAAQADQARGLYNYAAAIKIIDDARKFYPDSAKLEAIKADLDQDKGKLVLNLTNEYNEFMKQPAMLMPHEDQRDMTDVLATLRGVDPENAMLNNANLMKAYADLVQQHIKTNDYSGADAILDLMLGVAPKDPTLLGLNDIVQRELKRQADTQLVADIKERLAGQRATLTTMDAFGKARGDLLKLNELRPDDPLLADIGRSLRETLDGGIRAAVAAKQWDQAEKLLFDYAQLFSVPDLMARRDELSKVEVAASWAPANQSAQNALVDERRKQIDSLLAAAKFDGEMDASLLRSFKELAALMRPGNSWFDETRTKILDAYLNRATRMVSEDRYDSARVVIEAGERFAPGGERFTAARSALGQSEQQFKAELATAQAQAVIEQDKNTMIAAANAQDVGLAERLFNGLRDKLPADDAWLRGEGVTRIGTMFANRAKRLKDSGQIDGATAMIEKGLSYTPNLKELKDLQATMAGEMKRQSAYALASTATVQNLRGLPDRLSAAKGAFPQEAGTIQAETIKRLANRIKELEGSDLIAANDLWAAARELFPSERGITGLSLRAPPRPSQYAPRIRELIGTAKLTEAEKAVAEAKPREPNNEDLLGAERELNKRQSEANQVFVQYRQYMAAGNRPLAQTSLSEALKRWSDNPTFLDEQKKNFAVTTAPVKAADGSRPCTASLKGYGRQGRAECFDMPGGNKGPSLVVVPEGGGFSTPFAIGKFEVSVGEYNAGCRASGRCPAISGEAAQPATGMSLDAAKAYTAWLAETTGKAYRIASEAEWVYAATANNAAAVKDFNCRVTQGDQVLKGLSMFEIKTGTANPWGLINYVGNAQEFVIKGGSAVVRGGAFSDNLSECGIDLVKNTSGAADPLTGFRVSRDID
jgi:hypothetical protein